MRLLPPGVSLAAVQLINSPLDEALSYRHVGFAAGVHGFRHRVHQVAADAEVAHLHLTLSVDQYVGRFHVCGERNGRSR